MQKCVACAWSKDSTLYSPAKEWQSLVNSQGSQWLWPHRPLVWWIHARTEYVSIAPSPSFTENLRLFNCYSIVRYAIYPSKSSEVRQNGLCRESKGSAIYYKYGGKVGHRARQWKRPPSSAPFPDFRKSVNRRWIYTRTLAHIRVRRTYTPFPSPFYIIFSPNSHTWSMRWMQKANIALDWPFLNH